jgi:PKD repeat protein
MHDVEVDFGIANVLGCDSMLVDFVDLTSPVSSVDWVFGDGGASNVNNPQYIYYNEGFYDVTVFAESAMGCKDTLTRIEYIQFQYPTADISSNIQGICPGDECNFQIFLMELLLRRCGTLVMALNLAFLVQVTSTY